MKTKKLLLINLFLLPALIAGLGLIVWYRYKQRWMFSERRIDIIRQHTLWNNSVGWQERLWHCVRHQH
jgi:cell division protein FtsL